MKATASPLPLDGAALAQVLEIHASETFLVAADGGIVYANQSGRQLLTAAAPAARLTDATGPLDLGTSRALDCARNSDDWLPLSLPFPRRTGTRPMAFRARGLPRGAGQMRDLVLVADARNRAPLQNDVFHLRQLKTRLASQSREVDAGKRLQRELIHRVKNNLAVLSAVVRSSARATHSDEARNVLMGISRRITALSLSHDILDRTQQIDAVAAPDLFEALTAMLQKSLCPPGVQIKCEVAPVMLPVQMATPLSILINELVTNSFKHAFGATETGRIDIGLEQVGPELLRLRLSDNGSGFDPATQRRGSGSHIVEAVATQLGGHLCHDGRGGGTTWLIDIPLACRAAEMDSLAPD